MLRACERRAPKDYAWLACSSALLCHVTTGQLLVVGYLWLTLMLAFEVACGWIVVGALAAF